MTLSTMGKACSFSLTRENSCSGPKTSSGLYVTFPLFYVAICSECVYSLRSILNMTVVFLTSDWSVFNVLHCYSQKSIDFMKKSIAKKAVFAQKNTFRYLSTTCSGLRMARIKYIVKCKQNPERRNIGNL